MTVKSAYVTREDVIGCYKYILGRMPESEEAIRHHLKLDKKDFKAIRKVFIQSPEFMGEVKEKLDIECLLPPQIRNNNKVDCEASDDDLALLFDRIQKEWEELGKTEPHWSVLVGEEFKQKNINKNKDKFYESGMYVKNLVTSFIERHELQIGKSPTCFELGCGVGRITTHLSEIFNHVVAADISKLHLGICAEELKSKGVDNVELLTLNSPLELKKMNNFQLFCSFIVLQHNPPPVITFLLDTILKKLTPGGGAIFQVPVWEKDYAFDLIDYLHNPKPLHMEMHVLPQEQVFNIIYKNGCRLVEIREDSWTGRAPERLSNTFYVVKANRQTTE